jgi:branched-chain amino acid transport system ATP-binding protein
MLSLERVNTWYGRSQVLFGVSFGLEEGTLVSLMGRNGMGKTTTVRSILGLTPPREGRIRFLGREIAGTAPYRIGRMGIGVVPEGRQVFPTLTVKENLIAAAANRTHRAEPWTLSRVYERFPRLHERANQLGQHLSGGEQQMLAIARALMTNPKLLILDEATEGLAPLIRDDIWRVLENLKAQGQTILVIDKNLDTLARIADWHYVIEKGRIVWSGGADDMRAEDNFAGRYLGV